MPSAPGSATLVKQGNSNLYLAPFTNATAATAAATQTNTFNGGTIINSGQLTMNVQADAALGTGPVSGRGLMLALELPQPGQAQRVADALRQQAGRHLFAAGHRLRAGALKISLKDL